MVAFAGLEFKARLALAKFVGEDDAHGFKELQRPPDGGVSHLWVKAPRAVVELVNRHVLALRKRLKDRPAPPRVFPAATGEAVQNRVVVSIHTDNETHFHFGVKGNF